MAQVHQTQFCLSVDFVKNKVNQQYKYFSMAKLDLEKVFFWPTIICKALKGDVKLLAYKLQSR